MNIVQITKEIEQLGFFDNIKEGNMSDSVIVKNNKKQ